MPLAAASTNNRNSQQLGSAQPFMPGFTSPQATPGQILNQQSQQPVVYAASQQATKINQTNASSKAFHYLQKKGNLAGNAGSSNPSSAEQQQQQLNALSGGDALTNSHLIKRIGSGVKRLNQQTQ